MKMAAILGSQSNDKEPMFIDDSIRIRSKKKYATFCVFALRILTILMLISTLIVICIALYKANKGIKKSFIILEPGCASCDFLSTTAPSLEGEFKTSTETSVQAEIETTDKYLDDGNVTQREVISETRNETQTINFSGHTENLPSPDEKKSENLPPPDEVKNENLPPPLDEKSVNLPPSEDKKSGNLLPPEEEKSVNLPPPEEKKSENLPPLEKRSRVDYVNDNHEWEYKNEIEQKPKSNPGVYDIIMGYVTPVKDFVMRMINGFLSYFS